MLEFEFQLKRKEPINKSEEQRKVDRILNPESIVDENDYRTFYTPIIIDIDEMHPVLEDDAEHTALFDRHTGEIYIIKCKYRHFRYVRELLTGKLVRSLNDFAIDDLVLDKIEKINQVINSKTI